MLIPVGRKGRGSFREASKSPSCSSLFFYHFKPGLEKPGTFRGHVLKYDLIAAPGLIQCQPAQAG